MFDYKAHWLLYVLPDLTLKILRPATRCMYVYVLCGCQNQLLFFPSTPSTDWFLYPSVVCLLRGTKQIFNYKADDTQLLKS